MELILLQAKLFSCSLDKARCAVGPGSSAPDHDRLITESGGRLAAAVMCGYLCRDCGGLCHLQSLRG